jgi:hypothetical protein
MPALMSRYFLVGLLIVILSGCSLVNPYRKTGFGTDFNIHLALPENLTIGYFEKMGWEEDFYHTESPAILKNAPRFCTNDEIKDSSIVHKVAFNECDIFRKTWYQGKDGKCVFYKRNACLGVEFDPSLWGDEAIRNTIIELAKRPCRLAAPMRERRLQLLYKSQEERLKYAFSGVDDFYSHAYLFLSCYAPAALASGDETGSLQRMLLIHGDQETLLPLTSKR